MDVDSANKEQIVYVFHYLFLCLTYFLLIAFMNVLNFSLRLNFF